MSAYGPTGPVSPSAWSVCSTCGEVCACVMSVSPLAMSMCHCKRKPEWEKDIERIIMQMSSIPPYYSQEQSLQMIMDRIKQVFASALISEGNKTLILFAQEKAKSFPDETTIPEEYVKKYNKNGEGSPGGRAWIMWFLDTLK